MTSVDRLYSVVFSIVLLAAGYCWFFMLRMVTFCGIIFGFACFVRWLDPPTSKCQDFLGDVL